jgi:lactoylglutathione lyase
MYTMLRVSDLDRSLAFYTQVLGMTEQYRETFTEGRFTLVFLGYGDRSNGSLIELTYNWDQNNYTHGTGYGHIALAVEDINAVSTRSAEYGVNIVRQPGPMTFAPDETGHREVIAFIEDPDGYRIELIETPAKPLRN